MGICCFGESREQDVPLPDEDKTTSIVKLSNQDAYSVTSTPKASTRAEFSFLGSQLNNSPKSIIGESTEEKKEEQKESH